MVVFHPLHSGENGGEGACEGVVREGRDRQNTASGTKPLWMVKFRRKVTAQQSFLRPYVTNNFLASYGSPCPANQLSTRALLQVLVGAGEASAQFLSLSDRFVVARQLFNKWWPGEQISLKSMKYGCSSAFARID